MNEELKQLIEDAAKLLGIEVTGYAKDLGAQYVAGSDDSPYTDYFNPCDPERGDLMRVAEAAELCINCRTGEIVPVPYRQGYDPCYYYTKGDHQSKVLAILRAASAVYKSRGGV